jgi:hypothetical protein
MSCHAGDGFDPEFQLLLACSRMPADRTLVRTLCSQIKNWGKVIEYAQWHELTPIVGHALTSNSDALPSTTLEHFANNLHETARQNLFLSGELLRIMQALTEENIRAIPYKGPALAICAHRNLALRNFCDLDILVAEKNVPRTLKVMLALGYEPEYRMTPAQEAKYLRSACEYNFLRRDEGVQVEIHWDIVPDPFRLAFDFDRLWSRTHDVPLGGRQLRILSPEDTLLVLGVHGFKHMWDRLKWVCDIAILLSSSDQLDWSYLFDEADRIRTSRAILVALYLANDLFGSTLSGDVLTRLSHDARARSIGRRIARSYSEGPTPYLEARLLSMRVYSGFRDRATYLSRTLFNPSVEELVWAPERRVSTRRALRFLHVAGKTITNLCKVES